MRYPIAIFLASTAAFLLLSGPAVAAPDAKVAALQIGLRANGLYRGAIDGVSGPFTRGAVLRLQRRSGIRPTGRVGNATRCELGQLGKPLLGQRSLARGRVGWDVSVLEFRLRRYGLAHVGSTDASMSPPRGPYVASSGLTDWVRTASPGRGPSARS